MTQKELAEKMGLGSRSTLANYLAGTPIPSDKLYNFCKAMNCSADYLFGFDTNNTISLEGLSPTMVREVRIYVEAARSLKSNQ